jgi:hypothetical protein
VAAAYLGKALSGDVFCSTETVQRSVQPWSGLEPATTLAATEHNRDLADQPTVWLGMQAKTRSVVRAWLAGRGEPPLYCEPSYCGAPWLGNMSSALFSPFTWLFVVLPFAPAFALCAAAKWLLAGSGAWLLARRLGAGSWGCALAGFAFAFGGFQVCWIDSCLTNVSVFAPWLLLAVERLLERPSPGRIAAFALASWQVLVGGHPETSFWIALGAAVYGTVRWLGMKETRERKLAVVAALAAGAALGGALSIVQWWPFLEYALHSFGHRLREEGGDLFRPVVDPLALRGVVLTGAAFGAAWFGIATWRRDGSSGGASRAASGGLASGSRWIARAVALVALVGAGAALRAAGLRPALVLELLPDWYGRAIDGGHYGGPLTYNDVTAGYCGAACFLLALATALRGGDVRVRALAIAGLVVGARVVRLPWLSQLLAQKPLEQLGATRSLAFVALVVALLAARGVTAAAGVRADRRALLRGAIAALALTGGALVPVESIVQQRLQREREANSNVWSELFGMDAPTREELLRGGKDGDGWSFDVSCSAATKELVVTVNDHVLGRPAPVAAGGSSERRAKWRWAASSRVEDGLYHLTVERHREDGPPARELDTWLDLTRTPAWSARWLVPLGALAVVLALLALPESIGGLLGLVLVAATLAELLFFGVNYNATTPCERLPSQSNAPEPVALLQQKRRELGPLRVFTARTHLHPNLHLLFDDPPIDVLRGYDALEPLDYVLVLNQLYRDGREVPWTELDFATLDFGGARGAALADLLNVRFALSEEPPPRGWREVWRQKPADPKRPPLVIYENPTALPRAFVVQRGLAWRADFATDPRTVAIWDRSLGDGPSFSGAARVVAFDDRPGRLRATVESDAGTILVVSENALLHDNRCDWRATIDGQPADVRQTHFSFLSVVVPTPGRHDVEPVYRPRSVVLGLIASLGALVSTLVLALAGLLAKRRAATLS